MTDRTKQTDAQQSKNPGKQADESKGKGKKKKVERTKQDRPEGPDVQEDPDADDRLKQAHWETFPASDPPSFTPPK
jgi:hypothetical protein